VLYIQFENINGADRSLLEIVSRDGQDELAAAIGSAVYRKDARVRWPTRHA
jgi:hypothetical protein